ncbi:hypothetical protein [Lactococcus petauri]|jgi:hypothetical protein|uniref:Uncharacterized protein n=1 Tax=Lactococcus petauri TaxID=1940789 RepID=A0A252CAP3_9LACT|nr:hypothetical protein [Lactococcus petauri]OUK02849.1 hypothetical protein BZZ03_10455 [Lactococcus petauri]
MDLKETTENDLKRQSEHKVKINNRSFKWASFNYYVVLLDTENSNSNNTKYNVGDSIILEDYSGHTSEKMKIKDIIRNADDYVGQYSWYDAFYMMSEVRRVEEEQKIEDILNHGYAIIIF